MTLLKNLKYTCINILLLFSCWGGIAIGQEPEARRHFEDDTTRAEFYILMTDKKIRYKAARSYFWFHTQKLHITQNGAAGKVLHGPFTRFYHNGQLAEKGEFKHGLKKGVWRSWYPSGMVATEYHYRNGFKHGKYRVYDAQGFIVDYGRYRKGIRKSKREKLLLKQVKKDSITIHKDHASSESDTTWIDRVKIKFQIDPQKRLTRQQKKEERQQERKKKKEVNEN